MELGAAFLCAEFGFDGDLRHAGYIGHWIELLRADKRAFFTACSQASKVARLFARPSSCGIDGGSGMSTDQRKLETLFDVHPLTGTSFEVFYADRTFETFGRIGAGWFCWPRRRGFAPTGPATGPFPSSYLAYRAAFVAIAHRT